MGAPVFIVDDELDIRVMMRYALEDAGFQVSEAADGERAYSVLQASTTPLIVLLDLMLPKLDGVEIIRLLAAEVTEARRHVIIATTANYLFLKSIEPMLVHLQIPWLLKPFEIATLLSTVQAASERIVQMPALVPVPDYGEAEARDD